MLLWSTLTRWHIIDLNEHWLTINGPSDNCKKLTSFEAFLGVSDESESYLPDVPFILFLLFL